MIGKVAFCIALITMVGAAIGVATSLDVQGGTIQEFSLEADIDLPDIQVAALESSNQALLCLSMELPAAYDPSGIIVSSVLLCPGTVPCDGRSISAAGFQLTGHTLEVTFLRSTVLSLFGAAAPPYTVTLTVSGTVGAKVFSATATTNIE
jgi:hypothetical protein